MRGVVIFRGGGRGVGFWLAVGYRGNGLFVFHGVSCKLKVSQYVEILQENFEDSAEILNIRKSECYLLHDRDPSHIANLTQNYLGRERIRQILLPGNSPDLNVQ